MYLTIVKPDNLTLIDRHPQTFNLLDFGVPGNLHALQWQNDRGHIEYSNLPNEDINDLPGWVDPIVKEHRRLTELQTAEKEQADRQAIYLGNGEARLNRLDKQKQQKQQAQQEKINRLVMEKLA
ncbi:hypothetical protein NX722_05570 [Endozoicomonas gorgoniicola]|uniref:DUF4316 domain-containing protein n=1 Tax=Endozoicomonas gorgoniicola TaxID=1234144 RepID=A0ABT3MRX6_9GAMM|nr:hypothetical protein [Endozoicomonas gorgoniicola]MCW7552121.1 hypothetical protein [Endozoicomonas gorgoniicola]